MKKLVLDTSVLIEYIILKSPYRNKVVNLFDKARSNQLKIYVNIITLTETIYIASRIYQIAKVDDPNKEAMDFVEWIKSKAQVINLDENTAFEAGELKKRLHLSLPDCFVIASAKTVKATALFKKLEEEMKPVINELRALKIKFLDEIKI